ncbi:MAG TPA: YibE/F family protein, partial [Clostridium sp.]|nr:YibE/F family protein [Clostridium sp.]
MTKLNKVQYMCIAILAMLVLGLIGFSAKQSRSYSLNINENYTLAKALVQEVVFDDTEKLQGDNPVRQAKQEFQIKILDGNHKGERYKIRHTIEAIDMHKIYVSNGDKIIVNYTVDENDKITSISLYEISRENYLYVLIGIFILSVILICGKKGIKSVVSLLFTGFMILKVLIPIVISGVNPVISTISVCFVTIALAIVFLNGINKKSLISIIGTVGGITIAVVCAIFVGKLCKITGMADTESQIIAYTNS